MGARKKPLPTQLPPRQVQPTCFRRRSKRKPPVQSLRRMVDARGCRLTPPKASGRQWPVLFGPTATSLLMYVARNPRCKPSEARAFLESSESLLYSVVPRLRAMGLVIGDRQYELNPGLEERWYLAQLLIALGKAWSLPSQLPSRRAYGHSKLSIAAKMPRDLFWTSNRTSILTFILMMGESYRDEIRAVLGISPNSLLPQLWHLVAEGVMRARIIGGVKLYSLDPGFVAAFELGALLRRIARKRADLGVAVTRAYMRRDYVVAKGTLKQMAFIDDIRGPSWRIDGLKKVYVAYKRRARSATTQLPPVKVHDWRRKGNADPNE
jgi:hypothetical protein